MKGVDGAGVPGRPLVSWTSTTLHPTVARVMENEEEM
jgi:hypothetical protein